MINVFFPLTEENWHVALQNGFRGTLEQYQDWGDLHLYLMGIEETEYLQSINQGDTNNG